MKSCLASLDSYVADDASRFERADPGRGSARIPSVSADRDGLAGIQKPQVQRPLAASARRFENEMVCLR